MSWSRIIEEGDEVIVNGEILYVEKRAKKKWYKPFSGSWWWCYDGYGDAVLVKESDMEHKEDRFIV